MPQDTDNRRAVTMIVVALIIALALPTVLATFPAPATTLVYMVMSLLIASILDPLLSLCRVKKNSANRRLIIGMIISAVLLLASNYNQDLNYTIGLFSTKGGFTSIAITLIVLKITTLDYELTKQKTDSIDTVLSKHTKG